MSMKVGLIAGDGNFPLEVAKSIYKQEHIHETNLCNGFLSLLGTFYSYQRVHATTCAFDDNTLFLSIQVIYILI